MLTHHVNDYCSVHHISVEYVMIGFLLHVASDQTDHMEIRASDHTDIGDHDDQKRSSVESGGSPRDRAGLQTLRLKTNKSF